MEDVAETFKEIRNEVEKLIADVASPTSNSLHLPGNAVTSPSAEDKEETDKRSIYVGNVDYGVTAIELEQYFNGCGSVNRVTILCDKPTGHPKGFAYVEFSDKESVKTSLALDGSMLRGRQIKVNPKRTNTPYFHFSRRPRGRGRFRGRGRYGHGYYLSSTRGRRAYGRRPGAAAFYSPYGV